MGNGNRFRVIAILNSLALFLIMSFSGICYACTPYQIAEFRQKNIPEGEIRRLCGLSPDASIPDQPSTGSTCYVGNGSCELQGRGAIGTACWCNTPYGSVLPGEIR